MQDDHLLDCWVEVDWMWVMVTMTLPANGQQSGGPPANLQHATVGVASNDLLLHRKAILDHDLLGWFNHRGSDAAIMRLTQSMATGNQDTLEYQLACEAEKQSVKLPSQRWSTCTILMRALDVADL